MRDQIRAANLPLWGPAAKRVSNEDVVARSCDTVTWNTVDQVSHIVWRLVGNRLLYRELVR